MVILRRCFEVFAHVFRQVAEVEAVLVLNDLLVARILVQISTFSPSPETIIFGILGVDACIREQGGQVDGRSVQVNVGGALHEFPLKQLVPVVPAQAGHFSITLSHSARYTQATFENVAVHHEAVMNPALSCFRVWQENQTAHVDGQGVLRAG